MSIINIKEDVLFVGSLDWDRELFDELIPLPNGTTYNSYIVKGSEKNALIDAVDFEKTEELVEKLKKLEIKIDYVISNHAEQDHSGAIKHLLEIYPELIVVTNEKCKGFLKELLLIPEERFKTIKDRETLSLGGKTLEFILAPWVHWPETMITYLREDKILFTCDLFGSHLASSEMLVKDGCKLYDSAKRYYAEIMMPFKVNIRKHIENIEKLEVDIIAPSHGPIYLEPQFIINSYKNWISDDVKNEVIIPYVSMHGSTKKMVEYFVDLLMDRGIKVKPFNLTHSDIGEIAISLVDAATLIIGAPTFLIGPHPSVFYTTSLINTLRPKTKFVGILGSFGWGGKMENTIKDTLSNLKKVEFFPSVLIKGHPKKEDFKKLENLADQILEKHKEINIV